MLQRVCEQGENEDFNSAVFFISSPRFSQTIPGLPAPSLRAVKKRGTIQRDLFSHFDSVFGILRKYYASRANPAIP
jgi:hypothetical protein